MAKFKDKSQRAKFLQQMPGQAGKGKGGRREVVRGGVEKFAALLFQSGEIIVLANWPERKNKMEIEMKMEIMDANGGPRSEMKIQVPTEHLWGNV